MPDCVKFIPRSPIYPKSHLNHAAIGVSRPWTSARGLRDSEEVLNAEFRNVRKGLFKGIQKSMGTQF
jgi:hypothetical protein